MGTGKWGLTPFPKRVRNDTMILAREGSDPISRPHSPPAFCGYFLQQIFGAASILRFLFRDRSFKNASAGLSAAVPHGSRPHIAFLTWSSAAQK